MGAGVCSSRGASKQLGHTGGHQAQEDRRGDRQVELPAEQREPLLLVSVEQLSYAECAEVLRIPVGTVMSRLHRARERLRELMTPAPTERSTPLHRVK